MVLENEINTVRHELVERGGLLSRIALNEGVDLDAAAKLKSALEALIVHYKDKDEVPKNLAAAFIDLTPLFERSLDRYSEVEQEQIEDIRNDIVALAEELLG